MFDGNTVTEEKQALEELKGYCQWVGRDDKKIPINPRTGKNAKTTDPSTWGSFDQATAACQSYGLPGIGFVLTDKDPFVCIDLDHHYDGERFTPEAQKIIDDINSYTEISPSGKGVHIWVKGKIPGTLKKTGMEIYHNERYMTWTGGHVVTTPISICAREEKVLNLYFELLMVGKNYPSDSEADLALCRKLAKLCNNDREKIDYWFRKSPYYREKWEREDYKNSTLDKACSGKSDGPQTQTQLEIAREVQEIIYYQNCFLRPNDQNILSKVDDMVVKKEINSIAESKGLKVTQSVSNSILDLVKTHAFHQGIIKQDLSIIACKNTILKFNGTEFKPYTPSDNEYFLSQIPIDYDPNSKAPMFEKFLSEIATSDKRLLILEMMGYCLLSSAKFEKFFILVGSGANGKSVILTVIRNLVGFENSAAVQPSQLSNRFQRAYLDGKLVNLVSEIPEGETFLDAEIKAITSGESMTAEHKMKPPFDFQPICTLVFATNHMPHVRDFSNALFRRAIIIPFERAIPESEQDHDLSQKLVKELPGILTMALQAIRGVLERGSFTETEETKAAIGAWRLDVDQVLNFITECCEKSGEIPSGELYKEYFRWAQDIGVSRTISKKSFSKRIAEKGFTLRKGAGGVRLISGLTLKKAQEEN